MSNVCLQAEPHTVYPRGGTYMHYPAHWILDETLPSSSIGSRRPPSTAGA
jgi:hypothetical protein